MTSCRDILGTILELIPLGFKIQNANDEQINPATEDTVAKNFPSGYFSEKVTSASTDDVTVDPSLSITKTHLINLGEVEIVFAIGQATGVVGGDITLPANASISLTHDEVDYISYKGSESGGNFIYIVQGTPT